MKQNDLGYKIFLSLVTTSLTFLLSGCIYMIVGGIGAVGGYVVSPDTVEGVAVHDQSAAWNAANEVVSVMGVVEEQNEQAGYLVARIQRSKVTVTIIPVTNSTVKVNVKARKYFLPRISLAQDVFVKVMTHLNE